MIQNFERKNLTRAAIGISILLAAAAAIIYLLNALNTANISVYSQNSLHEQQESFENYIKINTDKLSSILNAISDNDKYKKLFLEKNKEKLYLSAIDFFEKIKKENKITHWYFIEPDGTCFLRVHNKDIYGDKIDRISFNKARKTNKTAFGLEAGKTAFALRVVSPYYYNNKLIGYVELGQEIDETLNHIKKGTDNNYVMLIDKKYLNKKDWAVLCKNSGIKNNWDDNKTYVAAPVNDAFKKILTESKEINNVPDKGIVLPSIKKDGKLYNNGAFPVFDLTGKKIGAIVYSTDITPFYNKLNEMIDKIMFLFVILGVLLVIFIKKIEVLNRKKDLEQEFGHILDNSWNEIFIVDVESRHFVYANKAGMDNLGYTMAELINMTPFDIDAQSKDAEMMKLIEDIFKCKVQNASFETIHKRKDGTTYPCEVQIQLSRFMGKPVILALHNNLAKQKQFENISKRFNKILNNSWNEIFIHDARSLKFLYANKKAQSNLGYSLEEFYELDVRDMVVEFDPKLPEENFDKLSRGEIITSEAHLIRKDGTTFPVEVKMQLFDNEDPPLLVVVTTDLTEKKEMEAAKTQLGSLLDNFWNEVSIINSKTFEYIYMNRAALANTGYTLEEIKGMDVAVSSPEFTDEVRKKIVEPLIKGEKDSLLLESYRRRKDGSTYPLEINLQYFSNQDPAIFLAVSRDITERKQSEGLMKNAYQMIEKQVEERTIELSRSRAQLNAIISNIPFWAWFKDKESKYITVNEKYAKDCSQSIEELTGKSDFDFFPQEIAQKYRDDDLEVIESKKQKSVEEKTIINDEPRWLETFKSPIINELGEIIGTVGIARDITERKLIEEELHYQDRLLGAAAAATNELIVNQNTDEAILESIGLFGNVLESDRMFICNNLPARLPSATILKYEWNKHTSKTIIVDNAKNIPFKDIKSIIEHLSNQKLLILTDSNFSDYNLSTLSDFNKIKTLLLLPIHTNDYFWGFIGVEYAELKKSHWKTEISILLAYLNSLSGVLERNQKQERLIEAIQIAESANKAKGNFLANMSHEIRTPMNGVIGFLQLLSETSATNEQKEFIDEAKKSSDILLHVINDILDFSKIEAGKMVIENISFDLRSTVEDVATMLTFSAHNKGLEINTLIYSDIPDRMIGDPGRLKQILNNIINNAIKFTNQGEIVINVKLDAIRDNHATILFEIADTGIGISKEDQEKLFESFTQADASTTRKFGGTGLGLAISKKLVELMDGNIKIESNKGQGTRVFFTAKFLIDENAALRVETNKKLLCNKNILLVDDNETNLKVAAYYLEEYSCNVFEARSADDALRLLGENNQIDAAIIDYGMPDVDGLELAEAIKSNPSLRHIPLVLLTSITRKGDSKKAQESGFIGYLTKPVRKNDLLECVALAFEAEQSAENINNDYFVTSHVIKENRLHNRLKILLVEDNEINRKLTIKILKNAEFNCDVANNGQEAVNAFNSKKYDLILMDCQMPVMDGYEATREIRNIEQEGYHIPIIAMTAHALEGDKEKCINAGMDDYITKPIDSNQLINVICRHISCKIDARPERDPCNDDCRGNIINVLINECKLDKDTANEFFNQFIKMLSQNIAKLSSAINNNSFKEIMELTALIKDASSNMRITKIENTLTELYIAAKNEDIDGCSKGFLVIYEFRTRLEKNL